MQLLKLSESTAARRRVPVYLLDDTDGKTPETGRTIIAGDVKISKNGAAEANHAGTLTELATGTYYYEFAAAELDAVGFLQFKLTLSGVRTFVAAYQVVAYDPYAAAGLGLTNLDAAITTRSSQTSVDDVPTNAELATALGAATVAAVAGSVGSVTGAVGSVTGGVGGNVTGTVASVLGAVGSVTGNVGGNVAGSVGSVVGSVASVVGAVGSVTGNVGGSVASVAANGITATSMATDAINAAAIKADAVVKIQAGLSTVTTAQVNAEVVDALATDTYVEPGQGAPAATATLAAKIGYLYKFLRNKITQTATEAKVYADDATTVDHKATVGDDGTTYTRGEFGTGA